MHRAFILQRLGTDQVTLQPHLTFEYLNSHILFLLVFFTLPTRLLKLDRIIPHFVFGSCSAIFSVVDHRIDKALL